MSEISLDSKKSWHLSKAQVILLLKHHISKCNRERQLSRSYTNKLKMRKTVSVGLISGVQHKYIRERVKQLNGSYEV